VARRLARTPSLNAALNDGDWWADAWADTLLQFERETGLQLELPLECPWTVGEVLDFDWLP
jgi:hypothetical protein